MFLQEKVLKAYRSIISAIIQSERNNCSVFLLLVSILYLTLIQLMRLDTETKSLSRPKVIGFECSVVTKKGYPFG